MTKRFIVLLLILLVGFLVFKTVKQKVVSDFAQPVLAPSYVPTPSITRVHNRNVSEKTSLFVPYWSISEGLTTGEYDSYLYFGLTADSNGLDMDEAGAQRLDDFVSVLPSGKESLLVIRLIDKDLVSEVLKNETLQKQIITQSLSIANERGFEGIILDLEISAIPLESLIKQITHLNQSYYAQVKSKKMKYGITLYGDTFYRIRPFDVKALSRSADIFYIMAYDFHKAKGNPGPNFPLGGSASYGYDMHAMSDDFLRYLPAEKVFVIFGLYGYDWEVDAKGSAVRQGKALTYKNIQDMFLSNCQYAECSIKRDSHSAETQITYLDSENRRHVVWFEDMTSVAAKEQMLKKKGIGSSSFWANGYF